MVIVGLTLATLLDQKGGFFLGVITQWGTYIFTYVEQHSTT